FVWTTTDQGRVMLRAWPWMSAPSDERDFECDDGTRVKDVVLHVADETPALRGSVTDASGQPVPFAFVDIMALEPFKPCDPERGAAAGNWAVYEMPSGRYQVTVTAPGRGIAVTTIALQREEPLALQLSGTGRIEGTIATIANGTIEVAFDACFDALDQRRQ